MLLRRLRDDGEAEIWVSDSSRIWAVFCCVYYPGNKIVACFRSGHDDSWIHLAGEEGGVMRFVSANRQRVSGVLTALVELSVDFSVTTEVTTSNEYGSLGGSGSDYVSERLGDVRYPVVFRTWIVTWEWSASPDCEVVLIDDNVLVSVLKNDEPLVRVECNDKRLVWTRMWVVYRANSKGHHAETLCETTDLAEAVKVLTG